MNNEKLIVDTGCWIMHDGYWMMDNGSAKNNHICTAIIDFL